MGLSSNKEQYYHQLTTLLEAGLSAATATGHLQAQRHQALPQFAKALAEGTSQGWTLSEALSRAPKRQVDPLETAMLAAAERGGKIELATRQLSEQFGLQAQLWKQIRQAMAYPLLVLHAAIILPAITVFTRDDGNIWQEIGKPLLLAYLIGAVVWFAGRWLWQLGCTNRVIDLLLNRFPGLGGWRRNLAHARFCQALGIQLQTGDNVANGVASAGAAAATANLTRTGYEMAQQIRDEGCPLGPLLLHNRYFLPELAQVLTTAELAGRLDEEALIRARKLMDNARNSAAQSGYWVPKLLYAPIALYAIYRIFQFYSSYASALGGALDV